MASQFSEAGGPVGPPTCANEKNCQRAVTWCRRTKSGDKVFVVRARNAAEKAEAKRSASGASHKGLRERKVKRRMGAGNMEPTTLRTQASVCKLH